MLCHQFGFLNILVHSLIAEKIGTVVLVGPVAAIVKFSSAIPSICGEICDCASFKDHPYSVEDDGRYWVLSSGHMMARAMPTPQGTISSLLGRKTRSKYILGLFFRFLPFKFPLLDDLIFQSIFCPLSFLCLIDSYQINLFRVATHI